MIKHLITICIVFNSLSLFAQNKLEEVNFYIGKKLTFHSEILGEDRSLNIYLPTSYKDDSTKHYPVIYLLDGSSNEDFIHIAGLAQFGSFPWIKQLPKSIVVGIANVDRKRDFTFPTNNPKDKKDFPTSGRSKQFIQFIGTEVQPLINRRYRTNQTRTIIGQSLGGLLVTEILFKNASLFDNYIIISPSLWWDNESLLNQSPLAFTSSKSIYIGVGKEGEIMERLAKQLYAKINSRLPSKSKVYFGFFEQLSHGDSLHLAVYDAFNKIFKQK